MAAQELGYVDVLKERRDAVESELEIVAKKLEALQEEHRRLDTELHHLSALLGVDLPVELSGAKTPMDEHAPVLPSPREGHDGEPADLVVALLEEVGEPLHYREIERSLRAAGRIDIGGQDPANTLLARYFKDSRLYRPKRGTYGLRKWAAPGAKSVGTRKTKTRSRRRTG